MHNHQEILKSITPDSTVEDRTDQLQRELESIVEEFTELEDEELEVEEQKQQQLSDEERLKARILELLGTRADKPSVEQIENWKKMYGASGIKVFAIDGSSMFIFTYLTGKQWEMIQSMNEKMKMNSSASADKKMREAVLKTCVLWPKIDDSFFGKAHAGLPTTLFELIMLESMFIAPQQAILLTTVL